MLVVSCNSSKDALCLQALTPMLGSRSERFLLRGFGCCTFLPADLEPRKAVLKPFNLVLDSAPPSACLHIAGARCIARPYDVTRLQLGMKLSFPNSRMARLMHFVCTFQGWLRGTSFKDTTGTRLLARDRRLTCAL